MRRNEFGEYAHAGRIADGARDRADQRVDAVQHVDNDQASAGLLGADVANEYYPVSGYYVSLDCRHVREGDLRARGAPVAWPPGC